MATLLAVRDAAALEIVRTSRHGYIVADEPGAAFQYGDALDLRMNEGFFFLEDISALIAHLPGTERPEFIAVMQEPQDRATVAIYISIRNELRGLGLRDPLLGSETWDHNFRLSTAYPLTGMVFLNTLDFFLTDGLRGFGRYIVCTQEFGHRYLANLRAPPLPSGVEPDAGAGDAGDPDASADGGRLPLAADALLGRDRSHWSYFLNTGGSPMEGNRWEETAPGEFHTRPVSFRFSPLDLYAMGVALPEDVPPFFLIAEPDVGTQRDMGGGPITRGTSPEYYGRDITAHGRRVTYSIDDVIRANGPRDPPARRVVPGGPPVDSHVAWVLLAARERVNDALAARFDQAVEWCSGGFEESTGGRMRLVESLVTVASDGGAADAAASDGGDDGTADAATAVDAMDIARLVDVADEDGARARLVASGGAGCGPCRIERRRHTTPVGRATLAVLCVGLAMRRGMRRGTRG